jgi:hypothetical protein
MATLKDCCPKCKTRFRVGALPTHDELRRMTKLGVINLGDAAPETINCPTCSAQLKVVSVRMGTYFSTVE